MKTLAATCLYTILHPDALAVAAALRGPTTFVVNRRMVSAERIFAEARAANEDVAVLFGDATDCRRLLYWARLVAISVAGADAAVEDTHYTVFSFTRFVPVRSPQELVLKSTGKPIAANYIRPYAVCRTPRFL